MKRNLQFSSVGVALSMLWVVSGYADGVRQDISSVQDEKLSSQLQNDQITEDFAENTLSSVTDEEADPGSVILDSDSDSSGLDESDLISDLLDLDDPHATACPTQGRQCIVYLQPHPSADNAKRNPLYSKVRSFIKNNSSMNEEKGFPPHVSMIGFFPCPTTGSVESIKTSISKTLSGIGKPLGRPILEKIQKVVTKKGERSLRITLSEGLQTRSYFRQVIANLRSAYPTAKCATHFPVLQYHISLALGNYSKDQLTALAAKAHKAFDPLHQWNVDQSPRNSWDIVLYRSSSGNTPPLVRQRRWRIN